MHRLWAPDPLLGRAEGRPAAALVVATPDVEARVLGVAQHRPDLGAAPGLRKRHLVLAIPLRRRIPIEIRVELVAELTQPETVEAVVLERHTDDRRRHGIRDEA